MEKEYQNFAEEVAKVIAKVTLNKLRGKGIEIVDYEIYVSYNYEYAILNDIAVEFIITGEDPITLSMFSYIRYTPDRETIGVLKGKKLLNFAEITGYKFPMDIHEMVIDYALFDLFNE